MDILKEDRAQFILDMDIEGIRPNLRTINRKICTLLHMLKHFVELDPYNEAVREIAIKVLYGWRVKGD